MDRKRLASWVALAIVALGVGNACMAAGRVNLRHVDVSRAAVDYLSAMQRASGPDAVRAFHASLLPLEAGSDLRPLRTLRHAHGTTYRYEQTHQGIPVYGQQVIINENASGGLESFWGGLTQGLAQDVPDARPRISRQRAIEIARSGWKRGRLPDAGSGTVDARLVVYAQGVERALLAYVVAFRVLSDADNGPGEPTLVIDAMSGDVLFMWDALPTAG